MKNIRNWKLLTNKKGQFTIMAAVLVAIVLVAAVMSAYSAIQYNQLTSNPKTQSAIDEINLSLKNILGFTVGYYGSILQVTGNTSYANTLAYNYVNSGLENTADLNPNWGPSFNVTSLDLTTNWFTNSSYSSGNFTIEYDLTGLGVYGLTYSTSSQLAVNVLQSPNVNQACVSVTQDGTEPLTDLGLTSFKFYEYLYSNSTWEFEYPSEEPIAYANGTYLLDIPSNLKPTAYILSVEDNRGIMVVASSFSKYVSTLTWNSTSANNGFYYVDSNNPITGTDSNFTAQQSISSNYDTLTEALNGTSTIQYFPTNWNTLGSTNYISGSLQNLQSVDGNCLVLQSYPSSFSSSYNTISFDSQNSTSATSGSALSWLHTTGTGNNRILLVSVDIYRSSGTPATVSNVTYGGVTLTLVKTATYSSNPQINSYVYMLVGPASGTKTITVTLSSTSFTGIIGGSVTYSNVNQTSPVIVSNTNTGSSLSQSVGVTSPGSYGLLYGHVATYTTSSYTLSDTSGQTNRWSQTSQQYKSKASDKSATTGSVSTSWTTTLSTHWTAIAVLLQPTKVATAYTCSAVFTGTADTYNWNNLVWSLNSASSTSGTSITYQLYNYQTSQYATSGNGYLSGTIGTAGTTLSQTITSNPTNFRSSSGNWQIMVTATLASSTQFNLLIDMINYCSNINNYDLGIQEQWNNVNATNLRQDLCIDTGNLASESLMVDVFYGNSWVNLLTLSPNSWNNVSLSSYITSSTLLIRFRNGNSSVVNPVQSSWNIGAVLLKNEPDISFLAGLQDSTFTLEVLQNGTMVWLGQQLQASTTGMPIPPIAVKALHVNMTINGVNEEVPFQVEDWASNYQVPLGLTNNATVFSNSQMIVFLLNKNVTDFTIWWNGSDQAVQTPYAYTSTYFANDNPSGSTISNGEITLTLPSLGVTATVVGTSTSSTATFMNINQNASENGAGTPSYTITNGVVRDIIQEEAEWSEGPGVVGCPNVYSDIIITLPANVTYYTYQLRLMFVNSAEARTITNLCPISLTTSVSTQVQTENGTLDGFPIIQNGTGSFGNITAGSWTAHHWSQLISSNGTQGAGIMFTDSANQNLYAFNSIANGNTGALDAASTSVIELLPVSSTSASASFQYPLDITWNGAVATFNDSTPICNLEGGTTPSGLWILVEYPPTITQTAVS